LNKIHEKLGPNEQKENIRTELTQLNENRDKICIL